MLLLDSDIFIKLGVCGLLQEAVTCLGAEWSDCRKLPALPHMLKGKKPRMKYGDGTCSKLVELAETVTTITDLPGEAELQTFSGVTNIDAGEAQLFALAMQLDARLATADKRAMRALRALPQVHPFLAGKLINLETIYLALCATIELQALKSRVEPIFEHDQMTKACFSSADVRAGLRSYANELEKEAGSSLFWKPAPLLPLQVGTLPDGSLEDQAHEVGACHLRPRASCVDLVDPGVETIEQIWGQTERRLD